MRALSIQKGSEIVKNEHAQYTLERFPTDNARVICTKKGIGKYENHELKTILKHGVQNDVTSLNTKNVHLPFKQLVTRE